MNAEKMLGGGFAYPLQGVGHQHYVHILSGPKTTIWKAPIIIASLNQMTCGSLLLDGCETFGWKGWRNIHAERSVYLSIAAITISHRRRHSSWGHIKLLKTNWVTASLFFFLSELQPVNTRRKTSALEPSYIYIYIVWKFCGEHKTIALRMSSSKLLLLDQKNFTANLKNLSVKGSAHTYVQCSLDFFE